MCNHSGLGDALNKINNSDKTHPLNNVIDQPLIDPILQGDMTLSGDVIPGSHVDQQNQKWGVSDASQAATFFAKSIAAAFGLAAAFGATPSGGVPNAAGTATGEAVGTGTATGAADAPLLTGQSSAQTVQGNGANGPVQGGGEVTPNSATGGDTLGNIRTGEGTGAADASGTNASNPTTTPNNGSTLGNALKLAAQVAPLVSAGSNLLAADAAANQASSAQNAANNLTPSTPPPEPQAAVDPDLSVIRKRNALIFGLDSPASTDLTFGKADMGSLGRVTLLGGSTNRLGA